MRCTIENRRKSSQMQNYKCVNVRAQMEIVEKNKDDPFLFPCYLVNIQCLRKKTQMGKTVILCILAPFMIEQGIVKEKEYSSFYLSLQCRVMI